VFWTRPQSYNDAAHGVAAGTWTAAPHEPGESLVDMVDWAGRAVDNVHAYTATLARNIEAEDTGVMSLRLRSGALASINVTC